MKNLAALALAMFVVGAVAAPLRAAPDPDQLRQAKALFFDHRYAEAREAWRAVLRASSGADADTAAYWIARCSENLGERERAFGEYDAFLARRPADETLATEARTFRLGLAARLYRAGRSEYLRPLQQALDSRQPTVRYYAAVQLAGLGPEVARAAVPILRGIVDHEKDPDLVDRARLALLRIDPAAASDAGRREPAERQGWLRVRVFDGKQGKQTLAVNVPLALAELVFKSLPDDTRKDLLKEGYDVDNFWDRLKALGPTDVVDIQTEDGGRIRIWIE